MSTSSSPSPGPFTMGSTASSIHFPNPGYQVLTSLIYFIGLTIITHYISRRIEHESLHLTFTGVKNMSPPHLWAILMFCQSWLFLLSSGVLIFGIGLEYSTAVCTTAIYLCIFFYSSSKFFVYAFLAEKVYIVWSRANMVRRFESPVYLTCVVSVSFYCIVMTLMLGGPIHEFASDGTCIIGLKPFGYIPLLTYDVYISIFLTVMFLVPLFRTDQMQSKFKKLAIRTLIATAISIFTSTTNIVVLMALKGKEYAWINLSACGADIIINASAIFWVSGRNNSSSSSGGMAVHSDQYHSHRHRFGTPQPSKSTPESSSDPNAQYVVHLEGDVNASVTPRPSGSWTQRFLNREKPAPPQLEISVTKEFERSQIELRQRDSPFPV